MAHYAIRICLSEMKPVPSQATYFVFSISRLKSLQLERNFRISPALFEEGLFEQTGDHACSRSTDSTSGRQR